MSIAIQIREPLGSRQARLPLTIGGEGTDLPVPGNVIAGLCIDAVGQQWTLRAADAAAVVVNGSPLHTPVPLAEGDVVRVGDAQLVVQPLQARIDVAHLMGNATVAPLQRDVLPGEEVVAGVREIIAAGGGSDSGSGAAIRVPARRRGSPLRWLGVVRRAESCSGPRPEGDLSPLCRLTAEGAHWLGLAAGEIEVPRPASITVGPDFLVHVPASANLYVRFQLERFADLEQAEPCRYRLTASALSRALARGIQVEQVLAFLKRAGQRPVPASVASQMRRWASRSGAAGW